MNHFDSFMGLIKETFIEPDKVKEILLKKYFMKFLHNLAHKSLKERKHFIAREHLAELGEEFMSKPFEIDL